MTVKSRTPLKGKAVFGRILEGLAEEYGDAGTRLVFKNPFELLVATVLSAQTTDEQVNRITEQLFTVVKDVKDLASMEPAELEPYLQSCGLFRYKSRYLVEAARMIIKDYGGKVPDKFDELLKLPGVGRKTANVIINVAYGKPGLAVDTHVFRVARRLGLAKGDRVEQVEEELKGAVPETEWGELHHRLIAHGRKICKARNPGCRGCRFIEICAFALERGITDDLGKTKS